MAPRVDWFFGRGLSISCGLDWSVPTAWKYLEREDQISRIKQTLRELTSSKDVDTSAIRDFLAFLSANTSSPWRHQFHTTNWDDLLQREIKNLDLTCQPHWCAETHVYHLNGSIEYQLDESHRSEFVLETDGFDARISSTEGDIAFNKLIWNRTFVVVGMSFECEVDKYLLQFLNRVQDDLPIGESNWTVVNPDSKATLAICDRLRAALPHAKTTPVNSTFEAWLKSGLPELQTCGAIVSASAPP